MSFNRSTIILAVILLVSILLSAVPATAEYPQANAAFPAQPPGESPGSVTGHACKEVTTDAVPFVYVAIVNANDPTKIYATTTTDDTGRFRFNGISSTGGAAAYRIVSKEAGFKDGMTEPFAIPSGIKVFVDVHIIPSVVTATPRPNYADGSVGGRVTEAGTNLPLAEADVSIVDPTNEDTVYFTTTTDQNGIYLIRNLSDFSTSYQVRVAKFGYKNGYSLLFQAEPGTMVDLNIAMDLRPPEITPFATSDPYTDAGQPTVEPSSGGLPIPGFGLPLVLIASTIAVAIVGRKLK